MNGSNRLCNAAITGLLEKKELGFFEQTNRNVEYVNWKREDSFSNEQGKSKFIKTPTNVQVKERAKATRRVKDKIMNDKISHNFLNGKEETNCYISKIRNINEQQLMSSLTTISHGSKKKKSTCEYNLDHTYSHSHGSHGSHGHNINQINKKLYHDQLRSNNIHNNQCRKNNSSKICKRCYIQKMQEQIEFIRERKQRTTVYVREFNDFLKYENFYEKIICKEEQKNKLHTIKLNRIHNLDIIYTPNEKYPVENKSGVSTTNEYNMDNDRDSLDKLSEQISFKKNLFLFLNNVFKKH